jgi:hypothetical protein
MASYPTNADKEFDLWYKIASNLRETADALGYPDLSELTNKESIFSLKRKVALYTARISAAA